MAGDAIFPIPEPTWLWVHNLTIYRASTSASVVDAEGRWNYYVPASAVVKGYLTAPNPEEIERAAAVDIRVNAVALVPRGTTVSEFDQLMGSGIDPILDGTYRISEVRPNLSHIRLILERIPTPDPWPDLFSNDVNVEPGTVSGGSTA